MVTMTTAVDDSFRQMNVSAQASTADDDLGFEDCTPDSAKDDSTAGTDAKNGYGDANPYGYGETPTAARLGYEDPDSSAGLGYDDPDASSKSRSGRPARNHDFRRASSHSNSSIDYGYGDDSGSGELQPDRQRRERPRRRGSVTKYSLDAQETVQQEFEAHAQAISQFRGGGDAVELPPPASPSNDASEVPLKGDGNGAPLRSRADSAAEMSEDDDNDNSGDDMSCEGIDGGATSDKKKKKKRFGRFRIGRNKSGMSTGSNTSGGSKK